MSRSFFYGTIFLLLLLLLPCLGSSVRGSGPEAEPETLGSVDQGEIGLRFGGIGGVYFLASPGELIIDVEKRDLNRANRQTELRAILVGPDRGVLAEARIPDDGKPRGSGMGPPRRVRLTARVERKGIYGLNVTVSQDRYGECIAWGFRSNCERYLIETARGHRDKRHEEPIVLLSPERSGDVCFLPLKSTFDMEVSGLPKSVGSLSLFDAKGKLIESLPAGTKGRVSHRFPAEVDRDAVPWRLHLPIAQATIQIDGVTRWGKGDLFGTTNLGYWTPDLESYFPFQDYRWLLAPYRRSVYGRPGENGEIVFQVHNNSPQKRTIELGLEFPAKRWPVRLSPASVEVAARRSVSVAVHYTITADGGTHVCHLRATPVEAPEFSTYSTLTVTAGTAPATQPLDMPLVLKPYRHENELFGYLPRYPVDNQVYFDLQNRPFVVTPTGLKVKSDGAWNMADLRTAVRWPTAPTTGRPVDITSSKVAFDRDNRVYLLGRSGGHSALLCSTDSGKTFVACLLPGHGALDIEQFSGHNVPDGPPPILRYTQTASDPKRIWRRVHDLTLWLPEKVDGQIVPGKSVLVSRQCIGLAAHSGIPSTVVSRGSKVHVVWAEATDPAVKVPGVPTYVATYDRATGELSSPNLVGYGPPANDIHNTPSITMDGQGFLHVLAGTHGQPFPYARSLKPNAAVGGWTEAELTGDSLPETYIGLVCGPDGTLHLVCRLWQRGVEPFPASHYATLAYQRKPPGKPWEAPKVLIVPPFSEYSVFYHRLTIDRAGRLFLSYQYWSTHWFYRTDHWCDRRAVLMSPDGGETWNLAGSLEKKSFD